MQNNYQNTLSESQLAKDACARQEALNPNYSYIVDAPAGAGKTELLTQRFLVLLAQVNEPEEIVALTFTRKAAAEMRNRIMASLELATKPLPPKTPTHKATTYELALAALKQNNLRQWRLFDQPSRLRVMTIDALSMSLARQMPLLTRFGTQPTLSTNCKPLYDLAAQDTVELLELAIDEADKDAISRALIYFDNDTKRLCNLLSSMLERRDQWQQYIELGQDQNLQHSVTTSIKKLIELELTDIAQTINPFINSAVINAARHAANNSPESPIHVLSEWFELLTTSASSLPQWRALSELFLTADNKIRKDYRTPINLAGKENKEQKQTLKDFLVVLDEKQLGPLLSRIRLLPDPQLNESESSIIKDLARLLQLAYGNLWLNFTYKKRVDHTEISFRAISALGSSDNPSALAQQLDYQIRHLLIDEFQDTNPTQIKLIELLIADWTSDGDRTLFLVGDPMQSIYRFRKADVGLFLRVREKGIGAIHPISLQLYQNNRSHQNIVEWVNYAFSKIFSASDDATKGAVCYSPAVAYKPTSNDAGVFTHPIVLDTHLTESSSLAPLSIGNQAEAQIIIDLIQKSRAERPEATVAVLVRARSHLDTLVELLQEKAPQLPFQAVEINSLSERQVIQDLTSLTRALHHLGDRINWLAILRAPWCGLCLEDLHMLASADHERTIWSLMLDPNIFKQLTVDGQFRLSALRQKLLSAYSDRSHLRPARWIEITWRSIGGAKYLIDSNDLSDAKQYFKLLDKLDNNGSLELENLKDEVNQLFASPNPSELSTHVQLMTIHKSKGLQFDTVIIPGLHKTLPTDDKSLIIWDSFLLDDDIEHLVVAPIPPSGAPQSSVPTPYDLLRALEKTRSLNEAQRLLYVAATRAERQLHLIGVAYKDSGEEDGAYPKDPAPSSLLAPLWGVIKNDFICADSLDCDSFSGNPEFDESSFTPKLTRVKTSMITNPASNFELSKSQDIPYSEIGLTTTIDTETGKLVHRYLEAIAVDGLNIWTIERVKNLHKPISKHFERLGYGIDDVNVGVEFVINNLIGAIESKSGQWILSQHESAQCELPMSSKDSSSLNEFAHHVIDRTFIDDKTRWIIDYKTSIKFDSNQSSALDLKLIADSHKPQLTRYASLFADEQLTVRKAIFFPALGKLIEI